MKQEIFGLIERYYNDFHATKKFEPGVTKINYAGRVYGAKELICAVDAVLDFGLTAGPYAARFERELKGYFKSPGFLLVNSGSSANLLMVATLLSKQVEGCLKEGDEVITPAVTFPTTLTPIVQNGLVPVFVDCEVGTYNMNPRLVEEAIGPRTRAILAPHTLGNPCDLDRLARLCRDKGLYLLEDSCDALGATYDGRPVGSFGDMASLSFYPAHHITMGEGGGVVINNPRLVRTALSIRDWGRDCWCEPGANNTCGRRFEWQLGDLPYGYDHKYIYSNLGYNLKVTDLQAAIGLVQWERALGFIKARRENFAYYYRALKPLEEHLILPKADPKADPSWFGFPITVRDHVERNELVRHLEEVNIETRLVFGGNILKQPGFRGIRHRVVGELTETDRIMEKTFFIGVYPGLNEEMREFVVERFMSFFKVAV